MGVFAYSTVWVCVRTVYSMGVCVQYSMGVCAYSIQYGCVCVQYSMGRKRSYSACVGT